MLIGRKNNSITWTIPSNNETVEPYGEPHWSSSLGDAAILDFRVQMATKEDFKFTKAHWFVLTGTIYSQDRLALNFTRLFTVYRLIIG